MNCDLVIRNGRIVTPGGIVTGDLGVTGETISQVGGTLTAPQVIDAAGHWVMPGGVDPHAHIEQMSGMGQMNADTFETAHTSAAMGGTTTVISFAAQQKGQRISETLADYSARAQRGAMIDHAFHISVCDPDAPDFATELAQAVAAGHRSIKVFTTYDIRLDDAQILEVMAQARASGALVCVHAETDALIRRSRDRLIAAGLTAPRFHAPSHPRMAEVEAVERICRFAEYLDQPVMLFHISTLEGAAAVAEAQARGAPVWAETCPHYLFMTADVLDKPGLAGAKWMCSPPQRTVADQRALWTALASETLHVVSSDHAPYRFDETGKLSAGPDAGFHQIANGLPGLETRMPVMFDAMMRRTGAGPLAFAQLTATNAARLYGLPRKGAIAVGMDADLVIWDPQRTHTYGADDLHDNTGYNPWEGRHITGWPVRVFLRGQSIVENGQCTATPGSGRWIARPELATVPNGNPAPEAS
ncbi:MAG: dihydropyrimidinase [Rhodobacteraceae bacterium]|nr:dihydropyrimidinase [Paracoccaceae bacterium]